MPPHISVSAVTRRVGIDTARYGHHVSFMVEEKRSAAKPFHFNEDAAGYQRLRKALDALVKKHPHVLLHIHMDAAGQYAENLLQWLHRQDLPAIISVGQPARNKAYRKVHYDKRKADPVESQACARFGVVERPRPTPPQAPAFAILRDTVAQMEASAKTRTRLINQLHNLLARAFPELSVQVKDISQKAILKLLERYPTAQRVAAAKLSSLQSIPHLKPELAAKLHEAAKQSTASSITPASRTRCPAINFAELRQQVSITQVLDLLRWPRPGSGKSLRGPCPIHGKQGEKDRSLAVDLTKNVYCCHHCGSSGNALDLWAASTSLPLLDAAWDVIERLDIEPPLLKRKEELFDAK